MFPDLNAALDTQDERRQAGPSPGLWGRIEAVIDATGSSPDDPAWTTPAPGVSIRVLASDEAGRPTSFMLRLDQGAVFPAHTPDQDNDFLVMRGTLLTESGRLGSGDSILLPGGRPCAAMGSPDGAMIYVSVRTGGGAEAGSA